MNFIKSTTSELLLLTFLLFLSCQNNLAIQKLSTPCQLGGEPNLHVSADGIAYLSWVEYLNDSTDVLAFSTLESGNWSAPKIIAQGDDWFVNWADFPSFVAFESSDKILAAHWLEKSAVGTYDYDIKVAISQDGGNKWQKPFIPHTDGIAAEHGFVSMIPTGNQIFATWLDGRYTKTENESDGHDHEGQGGAMTLRGAFFDKNGQLSGDIELDSKVCDCCATSAAMTKNGAIVAYRDRSDEEIRDISIVRQVGQDWTQPRRLHADNWEIAGCPVNGPKIVSDGDNNVGVAWFTMAQDTPRVKVAFSSDAGANFSSPIQVDEGNPLGRVDLLFSNNQLVVSWLEKTEKQHANVMLAKVNRDGTIEKRTVVTKTSTARSSGFPILEQINGQLLMAWTEVLDEEENTTIRSAKINF